MRAGPPGVVHVVGCLADDDCAFYLLLYVSTKGGWRSAAELDFVARDEERGHKQHASTVQKKTSSPKMVAGSQMLSENIIGR